MSILERFESYISPEPNSGCWLWTASLDRKGYGHMVVDGRLMPAHRLAYERYVGPIPAGLLACHKCDVRCCVNPDHLFIGTHADNMQDMVRKGRGRYAGRTHCAKGHPLVWTRGRKTDRRICPKCLAAVALKRYHQRKSA